MLIRKYILKAFLLGSSLYSALYRLAFTRFEIKDFKHFERKSHSQNGGDGISNAIFKKIGTTNTYCVEFCIS